MKKIFLICLICFCTMFTMISCEKGEVTKVVMQREKVDTVNVHKVPSFFFEQENDIVQWYNQNKDLPEFDREMIESIVRESYAIKEEENKYVIRDKIVGRRLY